MWGYRAEGEWARTAKVIQDSGEVWTRVGHRERVNKSSREG